MGLDDPKRLGVALAVKLHRWRLMVALLKVRPEAREALGKLHAAWLCFDMDRKHGYEPFPPASAWYWYLNLSPTLVGLGGGFLDVPPPFALLGGQIVFPGKMARRLLEEVEAWARQIVSPHKWLIPLVAELLERGPNWDMAFALAEDLEGHLPPFAPATLNLPILWPEAEKRTFLKAAEALLVRWWNLREETLAVARKVLGQKRKPRVAPPLEVVDSLIPPQGEALSPQEEEIVIPLPEGGSVRICFGCLAPSELAHYEWAALRLLGFSWNEILEKLSPEEPALSTLQSAVKRVFEAAWVWPVRATE